MVKTDSKPAPSLYQEELKALRTREGDGFIRTVPTFDSVQASLYRSRGKNIPRLPTSAADLLIPQQYTQTIGGENFLLHQDEKLLIFSTVENLRHLSAADTYYGDGTFAMCPELYKQLYSIHALVGEKMVPLVYALLPDKKMSTYKHFFKTLKDKAGQNNIPLAPQVMVTDFEVAAQNATEQVFQCELKGCLFHFRQALVKHAQSCGVEALRKSDESVSLFVKRAAALPLVRLADIDDVWMNALENVDLDNHYICKFADYVTTQWVERNGRAIWNHFDTERFRTTNHLEGWHSKLKKLGPCHPNIFKFIEMIQNEQCSAEIVILQLSGGGRLRPKRQKYRHLDNILDAEKDNLLRVRITAVQYADAVSRIVGM